MAVRFHTSRFHVEYGPTSLFERVYYKMNKSKTLKLHGNHFNTRFKERNIPLSILHNLLNFDPIEWRLITVEVRNDTGKFVNSTWEKTIEKNKIWITIGLGDVVQTIVIKETEGLGNQIIKTGDFFEFVSEVNKQLMINDLNQ